MHTGTEAIVCWLKGVCVNPWDTGCNSSIQGQRAGRGGSALKANTVTCSVSFKVPTLLVNFTTFQLKVNGTYWWRWRRARSRDSPQCWGRAGGTETAPFLPHRGGTHEVYTAACQGEERNLSGFFFLITIKSVNIQSVVSEFWPEQLLVCEQLLQVLRQHFLLQSQVDPGPSLTHLRQTLAHGLNKPGKAADRIAWVAQSKPWRFTVFLYSFGTYIKSN